MSENTTKALVFEAAEKLLLQGERPTAIKLKEMTGKSNPNLIYKALDSWWLGLGARVANWSSRPEMPQILFDLTSKLWDQALIEAEKTANSKVNAMEIEVTNIKSENTNLKLQLEQSLNELGKLNKNIIQLTEILKRNDGKITGLTEQLAVTEEKYQTITDQYEKDKNNWVVKFKLEIERSEASENYLYQQIAEWRGNYKELKEKMTDYEKTVHAREKELQQKINKLSFTQGTLESEIVNLRSENIKLKQENDIQRLPVWKRKKLSQRMRS